MSRLLLFTALFALASTANSAGLLFTWNDATTRVDGTLIDGEKRYHLRISRDGAELPIVVVGGDLTSYLLSDVSPGTYTAQIATSEDGRIGGYSTPLVTVIGEIEAARPSTVTISVSLDCDNCGLEIK